MGCSVGYREHAGVLQGPYRISTRILLSCGGAQEIIDRAGLKALLLIEGSKHPGSRDQSFVSISKDCNRIVFVPVDRDTNGKNNDDDDDDDYDANHDQRRSMW